MHKVNGMVDTKRGIENEDVLRMSVEVQKFAAQKALEYKLSYEDLEDMFKMISDNLYGLSTWASQVPRRHFLDAKITIIGDKDA